MSATDKSLLDHSLPYLILKIHTTVPPPNENLMPVAEIADDGHRQAQPLQHIVYTLQAFFFDIPPVPNEKAQVLSVCVI